jgi:hypothetical protein
MMDMDMVIDITSMIDVNVKKCAVMNVKCVDMTARVIGTGMIGSGEKINVMSSVARTLNGNIGNELER